MAKERINYKLDHPKAIILLLRERSDVRKLAGIHVPQGTDNRVGNLGPAMERGINSRNRVWNWVDKLHRLAGRYDNPTWPTWFLTPIAGLKLPTQFQKHAGCCLVFYNHAMLWIRLGIRIWIPKDKMDHKKKYHAFGTEWSLYRRLELFLELGGTVGRKRKKCVAIFLKARIVFFS